MPLVKPLLINYDLTHITSSKYPLELRSHSVTGVLNTTDFYLVLAGQKLYICSHYVMYLNNYVQIPM